MKDALKSLARKILSDYSIFWIYRFTEEDLPKNAAAVSVEKLGEAEAQNLPEGVIAEQAGFLGEGADAFITREPSEGQISAICIYWHGERYATRNFWPLQPGEAKLVQIITDPQYRGKGAATALIQASSQSMLEQGYLKLYARVWHSNTPSLRAFERAGWRRVALALELKRSPHSDGLKIFLPPWRR